MIWSLNFGKISDDFPVSFLILFFFFFFLFFLQDLTMILAALLYYGIIDLENLQFKASSTSSKIAVTQYSIWEIIYIFNLMSYCFKLRRIQEYCPDNLHFLEIIFPLLLLLIFSSKLNSFICVSINLKFPWFFFFNKHKYLTF